jgi:hypothetical protein
VSTTLLRTRTSLFVVVYPLKEKSLLSFIVAARRVLIVSIGRLPNSPVAARHRVCFPHHPQSKNHVGGLSFNRAFFSSAGRGLSKNDVSIHPPFSKILLVTVP